MTERPDVRLRDLLQGLTHLFLNQLNTEQAIVLGVDDHGRLMPLAPADATPDLVARAVRHSSGLMRSVGGDMALATSSPRSAGNALHQVEFENDREVGVATAEMETGQCVPISWHGEIVGILYHESQGNQNPPAPATPSGHVRPLEYVERDAILHALQASRGNRTVAAQALGISVRKLQYRIKEYQQQGIEIA